MLIMGTSHIGVIIVAMRYKSTCLCPFVLCLCRMFVFYGPYNKSYREIVNMNHGNNVTVTTNRRPSSIVALVLVKSLRFPGVLDVSVGHVHGQFQA